MIYSAIAGDNGRLVARARWLIATGIFLLLIIPATGNSADIKFDGIDDDCWLDFTWTEPENADSTMAYYNIYVAVDSGDYAHYDTSLVNSCSVYGDSGRCYKIKVAGVNQYGEEGLPSLESNEILCLAPSPDDVPPKSINALSAEESEGTVLLSWPEVNQDSLGLPEEISHYVIYRNQDPYFTPDSTDSIAATQTSSYLDEDNGIGSAEHNFFYLVTAVDVAGNESQISNRVGEYDYAIIPHESGYHLISLILDDGQIGSAKDLGQAIPHCTAVKEWDPQIQAYVSRAFKLEETWYGETELQSGYPYYVFVEAGPESTWALVGSVPADPVFMLLAPGGNGYNTITLPLSSILSAAKDLGESVPHCTAVKKWDPQAQAYVSIAFKVDQTWFGEAAIYRGQPYFVNVTDEGIWPEGKVTLSSQFDFHERGQK
jgi:hypothetical protein